MPKAILSEQGGKGSGDGFTLLEIKVTSQPQKTEYLAGDTFSKTGMVVTAYYGINGIVVAEAPVDSYTVTPTPLVDETTEVTIHYSELGVERTTTVKVTVIHKLTRITCTNPTTTTYQYGDQFNKAGCVVTAYYSDQESEIVTDRATFNSTNLTTIGSQQITVSYTEHSVNQTTTITVTVNRKEIAKPTWIGDLTYNEAAQTVTDTQYWQNYDPTQITIGGDTTKTDAGTYHATFTPKENWAWTGGTFEMITVDWTIKRATGTLTPASPTVEISIGNKAPTVVFDKHKSTGQLNASELEGVTTSWAGSTLTITGDGETAIEAGTITVTMAQDTNYTQATATVTVNAVYWTWGEDNGVGDAQWWAGLKAALKTGQNEQYIGKKKKVTLSTSVWGWNSGANVSMTCIGADIDTPNSVTFQTTGCSPTNLRFGSNTIWSTSEAKTGCENFATHCSASDSITTITKLTCTTYNTSQNGAANGETECKGFLPSDCEMGFIAGKDWQNGKGYASSYSEYTKGRPAKAYPYYESNARRIKNYDSADGTAGSSAVYYWERSRSGSDDTYVCRVSYDGTPDYGHATSTYRLAPAFVIGN